MNELMAHSVAVGEAVQRRPALIWPLALATIVGGGRAGGLVRGTDAGLEHL